MSPELLEPRVLAILVPVGGSLLVAAIAIGASAWRKVRIVELEIGLKREMLDRGMSAEEIERVLQATVAGRRGSRVCGREWARRF